MTASVHLSKVGFPSSPQTVACFSISKLCMGIALALPALAFGETPESNTGKRAPAAFNTSFLQNGGAGVDLSEFLQGSNIAEGSYRVDIHVNSTLVGRQDVRFEKSVKNNRVEACLTLDILESIGLDMKPLHQAGQIDEADTSRCYDLPAMIPLSSVEYDAARQQLNIGVPQASMARSARGYVDPALWDEGVTAGFIDYNANGRRDTHGSRVSNSYTMNTRNGINLGAWRLRNESNLVSREGRGAEFNSNRSFAQRDITSLKSQLTVGTAYTESSTFDSIRLKGVMLASDDAMLPDSQRGYAPIIHGDAETNASVEVRQNGYMIYNTNVAPGPFVIDDLYPNGSNGDLEVTVIEADGRRRVFTQSFASLPQMVRKGMFRQNVAVGQYDSIQEGSPNPKVVMGGLAYGLTDEMTVLGGLQWAPDFTALNLGVTQNTSIGAFSVDVTQSTSDVLEKKRKGQSARLLYAKTIAATDTTFTLASYRYSTEGYRTLSEHVNDQYYDGRHGTIGRAKSRFDLTLNQSLGERKYGALYFTVGEQRYWNLDGKSRQYTFGYSSNWRTLSYSLGATYALTPASSYNADENRTRVSLTLSLPIGSGSRTTSVSSTLATDNKGERSLQSGINGRLIGTEDAYYSVSGGHETSSGNSFGASVNGTTSVAQLNAGYSQGADYKSVSAAASGSIVAHGGGINLGQPVGDSFALAHVPGATGSKITNHAGVTVGRNGYAVVPYTQPYRNNWINLDSSELGADIEIDNPTRQVIPRRGSVTVASFAIKQGRRVQFELVRADGSALPFGASVEAQDGRQLAIADPFGYALVLLEDNQGTLKIKADGKVCEAPYALSERTAGRGYDQVKVVCQ